MAKIEDGRLWCPLCDNKRPWMTWEDRISDDLCSDCEYAVLEAFEHGQIIKLETMYFDFKRRKAQQ